MMRLALILLVVLSACVHGDPVGPEGLCPDVTFYFTLPDTAVADSAAVRPDSVITERCK